MLSGKLFASFDINNGNASESLFSNSVPSYVTEVVQYGQNLMIGSLQAAVKERWRLNDSLLQSSSCPQILTFIDSGHVRVWASIYIKCVPHLQQKFLSSLNQ